MDAPVAVVTAASRGIGAACARELAGRGYRLALMARSEGVTTLAAELGGVAVRGSVTAEVDLQSLLAAATASYGRIDAVVNNTGDSPTAPNGDLLALDDSTWRENLDLLLLNVVRMARLVTPIFLAQGARRFSSAPMFPKRRTMRPLSQRRRRRSGAWMSRF